MFKLAHPFSCDAVLPAEGTEGTTQVWISSRDNFPTTRLQFKDVPEFTRRQCVALNTGLARRLVARRLET
jgi:hypothetical protein